MTPAFFDDLGSMDLQQLLLQQLINALLHTRLVRVSALIKAKLKKVCWHGMHARIQTKAICMFLAQTIVRISSSGADTPR